MRVHQPANTHINQHPTTRLHVNALRAADPDPFATRSAPISSIDIDAIDVGASSDSSCLDSSDSGVEVEVTQVVQQQQQQQEQEEVEGQEDLGLELDKSAKSSRTWWFAEGFITPSRCPKDHPQLFL